MTIASTISLLSAILFQPVPGATVPPTGVLDNPRSTAGSQIQRDLISGDQCPMPKPRAIKVAKDYEFVDADMPDGFEADGIAGLMGASEMVFNNVTIHHDGYARCTYELPEKFHAVIGNISFGLRSTTDTCRPSARSGFEVSHDATGSASGDYKNDLSFSCNSSVKECRFNCN